MSQALVDDLKAAYPFFTFANRFPVPKSLYLADGEEIVVPGYGIAKVASAEISSLPDIVAFDYKEPTLSVLDEYGVLNRKSADEVTSSRVAQPEPSYTPSPINEPNSSDIDPDAAGNQNVISSTSPTIDSNVHLETQGGLSHKPSGQR